jgi:hypothetical protein
LSLKGVKSMNKVLAILFSFVYYFNEFR